MMPSSLVFCALCLRTLLQAGLHCSQSFVGVGAESQGKGDRFPCAKERRQLPDFSNVAIRADVNAE